MTDENDGFFSNADDSGNSYDSGYSYEPSAPATESDSQIQQGADNTQQQQAVNQPNPEYEALRQELAQEKQRNQRFEQDWNRFRDVFVPEQKQDPQQAALNEFVANPTNWKQQVQQEATNAAIQQLEYTMAEREVLNKYPQLSNVQHLIRNEQNIQQGFLQFQQKNGRPPQTPAEQVQAAVDYFMSSVGWTNQTHQAQQVRNTIPLTTRGHSPSREEDPEKMSKEQFNAFVQQKMARHYQ